MSGGSFSYLYSQDTLLGKHETVEDMVAYIRRVVEGKKQTKHVDGKWIPFTAEDYSELMSAANELGKLATWLEHVQDRCDNKQEFYRDLLHSIEWSASGDSGPDSILEEYKRLMEKK